LSNEKLRRRLRDGIKKFSRHGIVKIREWSEFAEHIRYQPGDFKKSKTYAARVEQCMKLKKTWGTKAHHIFKVATSPSLLDEIPKFLGKVGLARDRK